MPLALFALLQLLDVLTTVVFLQHGVQEANPLMRALLVGGSPALALATPKLLALGLAFYTWRTGRLRMLQRVNFVFALCVVWNVAAIVMPKA